MTFQMKSAVSTETPTPITELGYWFNKVVHQGKEYYLPFEGIQSMGENTSFDRDGGMSELKYKGG